MYANHLSFEKTALHFGLPSSTNVVFSLLLSDFREDLEVDFIDVFELVFCLFFFFFTRFTLTLEQANKKRKSISRL